MSRSHYIWFLVGLSLMCFAAGCSTRRAVYCSSTDWKRLPYTVRIDSLQSLLPEWSSISFSGKTTISIPEKHSASVKIFMVRDSMIHASLRMYGVEGAIISMTEKSVAIYDKVNGIYSEAPFSTLMGHSHISLSDLQNIICGSFFPSDSVAGSLILNDKTNFPEKIRFVSPRVDTNVNYSRWENTPKGYLPARVEAFLKNFNGRHCKINLKLSIGSVRYDTGRVPVWRIARNIRAVDFDQLINIFFAEKR